MTLFRQINSLLFGLFFLVMASIVYFQFSQTKHFMQQQMQSDLNNTSVSLGLMLKPHLETGDMVAVETLVNVIFEGGLYQRITLTSLKDNSQQVWENPDAIHGVPQWFSQLPLFESQTKESLITSEWMQLATLEVEAHPGLGYQQVWRAMNDTLMVLSLIFLIAILILRIGLSGILKPLNEIARHAKGITEKKFNKQLALPSTTELKDVVISINTMSEQLKTSFNNLDNELDSLRKDSLVDKVSLLPNRQYLTGQLRSILAEPGHGALILAKFDWLDDIHAKYGYQLRDETILILAKEMQQQLPQIAESIIARVANTEFAFLITHADKEKITTYVQTLVRLANQEMSKAGCEPNHKLNIGIGLRAIDMTPTELMSQADNALQQAANESKVVQWFDNKKIQHQYTREQWRERLSQAIHNNQFAFQWQPIRKLIGNEIIQREVYCRLRIDNQIVTAATFMPYVEMLSLGAELDKCILKSMISNMILVKTHEPLAINLTRDSVKSASFRQWLANFLQSSDSSEKLHFEIPESVVSSNMKECIELADIIKNYGSQLGIDQCGRRIGSLNYLQEIRPSYVKLDQSFSFYSKTEQNSELCRALINVAKGLEINVVITGIEDEQQLSTFENLGPKGYQGYIYPPSEIV